MKLVRQHKTVLLLGTMVLFVLFSPSRGAILTPYSDRGSQALSELDAERVANVRMRASRNLWKARARRYQQANGRLWRELRKLKAAQHGGNTVSPIPNPIVADFLCIHDGFYHSSVPPFRITGDAPVPGAGPWNDSGDPYWGGLQMDRDFMATYGSWAEKRYHGYADVWPPSVQLAVAYAAYRTRGFYPWPNTARACGLI